MANHLDFLIIDLNGVNKMDFEDLKKSKSECFIITREMLDNCDINESITLDSITTPKVLITNKINDSNSECIVPAKVIRTQSSFSATDDKQSKILTESKTVPVGEVSVETNNTEVESRCEDTIFGELVAAMLKKMSPNQKKQAKRDIMNIIL